MGIMHLYNCGIWIKDSSGILMPVVYYGIPRELAKTVFSGSNINTANAFEKGAPFQALDLTRHCSEQLKWLLKKEKIRSLLACPVITKEKPVGIIAVFTRNKPHKFTKTEKMILSMLAEQIAFGIKTENLSQRVRRDYMNTIKTIAHIMEANDHYTFGHSNKVMKYAVGICRMLKLRDEDVYQIKNAALLHDIGKVGVSSVIVNKNGALTQEEWQKIKKHPEIGAGIIGQAGFLDELMPIVKHHHEKFCGGGYPDPGMKYYDIPMGARIISIADAFDAMTSSRPYRDKPLSQEDALAELKKHSGTQFDPELVEVFIKYIQK